jgi:hypothetical protein
MHTGAGACISGAILWTSGLEFPCKLGLKGVASDLWLVVVWAFRRHRPGKFPPDLVVYFLGLPRAVRV